MAGEQAEKSIHAEGSGAVAQGDRAMAAGERGVVVGGDNNGVIITGDKNLLQVFNTYVEAPRTFYRDIRALVHYHSGPVALLLLSEVALLLLFLRWKDRFLLRWDLYVPAANLLVVVAVCWIALHIRVAPENKPLLQYPAGWQGSAGVALLTFLGLVSWQVANIIYPPRFAPEEFGIAIATFGSGSRFRATEDGYEISSRIFRELQEAIDNSSVLQNSVRAQRIGVLSDDSKQAEADGLRIGAKLVIWGRLVRNGQNVDAHFKVLQAPDLLDNPAYPQTLPVTDRALDSSITLSYVESDDLKEIVERQSLGIVDFSLGLAHFYDRQFKPAAGNLEEALTYFAGSVDPDETIQQPDQNLGLVYYFLGRTYQILGRFEESQRMFEEAERYTPDDLAMLLGKIYNYRVFGEEDKRLATYRRILELSTQQTTWPETHIAYNRALAFDALEEKENAIREYKGLISKHPDFYIAYLGLGRLLTQEGRIKEAQEVYQQAEALAAGDRIREIWLELGKAGLFQKQGLLDAAVKATNRAIELDTDNTIPSLYYFLAQIYKKMGNVDDAIASYRRLIDVSYLPQWGYSALGEYLAELDRCDGAVDNFEHALQYPGHDDRVLWARLGLAYHCVALKKDSSLADQALQEQTMEAFSQALEVVHEGSDDGEAWIRHEYARVLYDYGDVDGAIEQFEQSLAVDDGPAFKTLRNLGQLYEQTGQVNLAIEQYERVMAHCAEADLQLLLFVQKRLEELGGDLSQCDSLPKG